MLNNLVNNTDATSESILNGMPKPDFQVEINFLTQLIKNSIQCLFALQSSQNFKITRSFSTQLQTHTHAHTYKHTNTHTNIHKQFRCCQGSQCQAHHSLHSIFASMTAFQNIVRHKCSKCDENLSTKSKFYIQHLHAVMDGVLKLFIEPFNRKNYYVKHDYQVQHLTNY